MNNHGIDLFMYVFQKFVQMDVPPTRYIIGKIIAQDNLNTPNLMQTCENLLKNYPTESPQIALGMCNYCLFR